MEMTNNSLSLMAKLKGFREKNYSLERETFQQAPLLKFSQVIKFYHAPIVF